VIYLLPSVVAQVRRHHQTTAIIGLKLQLGWTFIGWVVVFVWALTATPPPAWAILVTVSWVCAILDEGRR
jgi:hypothetical protein